jgi:hypothetical protein
MVLLRRVGFAIYMLALLWLGTYCLARPRQLQERVLRMLAPQGRRGRLWQWSAQWSRSIVQSDDYLRQLRMVGIIMYLALAVALFFIFIGPQDGPPRP